MSDLKLVKIEKKLDATFKQVGENAQLISTLGGNLGKLGSDLGKVESRLEGEIHKNGIMLEQILSEVKTIAEGFTGHSEKLDNHEIRIANLESQFNP